jgi:hypothetical protein
MNKKTNKQIENISTDIINKYNLFGKVGNVSPTIMKDIRNALMDAFCEGAWRGNMDSDLADVCSEQCCNECKDD